MNFRIVISGPSGAGKTTLINEILKNEQFVKSISCTTRDKRDDEVDGKDYIFLSKEEFKNKYLDNCFFEVINYDYNFYGILNEYVENKEKDIIFDLTVSSGLNLKRNYSDNTILIYILPKNLETLNIQRGDRGDNRLYIGMKELKEVKQYDYLIINDTIENMVSQFNAIMNVEKNNIMKNKRSFIDSFYDGKNDDLIAEKSYKKVKK